jgi:hypothetical protein
MVGLDMSGRHHKRPSAPKKGHWIDKRTNKSIELTA